MLGVDMLLQDYVLIFFTIFAFVVGLLMWYFGKTKRVRRVFKAHAITKIRDCKDGQAHKVCGDLQLIHKALVSPLTQRKCAVYSIAARAHINSADGGRWADIIHDERKTDFLITDGQIYAYVKTYCTTLLLNQDEKHEVDSICEASDQLKNYLENYGLYKTGLSSFDRPIKCHEGILEEGEKVAVLGTGRWYDIAKLKELKYLEQEGVSKVFLFKNDYKNPLFISDDVGVLKT